MEIIGRKKMNDFKFGHADARSHIDSLEAEMSIAEWSKPGDVKQKYPTASILSDNQVVFNVRGNKYRLLVKINYKNKIILIKKIGNHNEYMKW